MYPLRVDRISSKLQSAASRVSSKLEQTTRTHRMSQAGKGIRSLALGLTFAATILIANTASAWDGSVTGLIAGADVTDGVGHEFRIDLQGSSELCGSGGAAWAYVNRDNPNYQAYVATLLA
jgi:hypothetical protein